MAPSGEAARTAWRLCDGLIVLARSPIISVKLENITGLSNEAMQLWNSMKRRCDELSMKRRCDELGDTKRCLTESRNNLLQLLWLSGNTRRKWTQDDLRHMMPPIEHEQTFLISALGALPPKRRVMPPLRAIDRTAEASTAIEPPRKRARGVFFVDDSK